MTIATRSEHSLPTATLPPTPDAAPREGRDLIDATRPFAVEIPTRSAWYTVSTMTLLALAAYVAVLAHPWPLRLAASIVEALLIVRGFILFHDHLHGAILRDAAWARGLYWVYGLLVLTPPRVWRETHNYHHAHTAKIVGSHIGSYMTLTAEMYRKATPAQQRMYRIARHPLTIVFGYLTIFVFGMCISPLIRNGRKHWEAALALALHVALSVALWHFAGPGVYVFAFVLPLAIAFAAGAYLFYAQHNFPGMLIQPRDRWSYTRAALESSSYMRMSPVMHWFTGNIGYHHVHHLNPRIPFHRLPEAMAAIPELQHPHETSLAPREILRCLRLKVWNPEAEALGGYPRT